MKQEDKLYNAWLIVKSQALPYKNIPLSKVELDAIKLLDEHFKKLKFKK